MPNRLSAPENMRGFENNRIFHIGCSAERALMIKESTLDPNAALYRRVVLAGDYWIHVVRKGETFRIVDLEGNQAADTLFYNAADPAERYSRVRHDSRARQHLSDARARCSCPIVAGRC